MSPWMWKQIPNTFNGCAHQWENTYLITVTVRMCYIRDLKHRMNLFTRLKGWKRSSFTYLTLTVFCFGKGKLMNYYVDKAESKLHQKHCTHSNVCNFMNIFNTSFPWGNWLLNLPDLTSRINHNTKFFSII